ncbi:MAG: hypothetical protein AAF497_01330, partial [Planctomycetota bacterium]
KNKDETKEMKFKRKQLFVDSVVQGAILKRIFLYWGTCVLFVTLPILLTMTTMQPDKYFYEHLGPLIQRFWPIYLTLSLLLPFVMRDALKMSNRFCGPMTRVITELRRVNEGGEFKKVEFRTDDFWKPLADAINEFATKNNAT